MKQYIFILMAWLLVAGCDTDNESSVSPKRALPLTMSTLDNTTRAYWHDGTPEGGQSAVFHWEQNNSDVQAVVYRAAQGKILPWTGGDYSTYCTVAPLTDDTKADITSDKTVEDAIVGTRVYYVAHGSNVAVPADASKAEADFTFPESYNLVEPLTLEQLKSYTYMYASTIVESITPSAIIATPVRFDAAVACLRLIVENPSRHAYKIRKISMKAANGTAIFPDRLVWRANSAGLNIVEPDTKTGYRLAMSTHANTPDPADGTVGGIEIAPDTKQTYYMIIPPISNWLGEENLMFEIEYATGRTIMTTPGSLLPVSKIPNGKLEAGKIYNLSFREMILDVDHVTVDEWIENKITVGQVTVNTSEVSLSIGNKVSVRINVGHHDDSRLSATSKNGKVTATIRYDSASKKMYVDITRSAEGEDEVTVNDLATNSFATITVK